MSQVHYKFQSSNRHDSVHFDGVSISPSDLRKAILEKERLQQSTDFKLQLQNAQTKEVYEDKDLIPKNSSVTVTRVPISKELKGSQDAENMGEDSHLAYLEKRAASTVSKAEEEQIKAMMHQSTVDYSPDNFQHHGGRPRMHYSNAVPPPGYICNKCGKTGHFITHCRLYSYAPAPPMANRPRSSAAGIPSDRLRPCDPDTPGAQWTRNGWMVNVLDEAAYAEAMQKKSKTPSAPKPAVVFDIPEHFLCNKCKEMMEDAVRTPCCQTNYCDKCIRDILMEDEEQTCPNCNEIEVSPDSLVPVNIVRSAISTFLNKSKSGVRRRPDDKPVGSPAAITGKSSPVPVTSNTSINGTLSSTTQPASVVSTQAPSIQPSKGTGTPDRDIVQSNQTETQSKTESQVPSTSHLTAQGAAAPAIIAAAVPTSTVLSASSTQSVPINNVTPVTASSAVQITMPVAHTVVTSTQLTNNHQTVLPAGTVVTYGTLPNQTLTHNALAPTGAVFSAGAVVAPIPGTVMSQTYTMPMVNSGAVVPVNYQTPLQVPYNASATTGFTAPGFPAGMRPAAYGAITGPAGLPIPTAADKESALALLNASSGRIMSKEEFYKVKATLLEEQIKKTEVKTKNDDVSEFFRDTLGRRRSRSRSPRSPVRRMRSPGYRRSYSRSPSPTRYRSPPPSRYHRRHSRERYRSISPHRSIAPPYARYNDRERRRDRYHEERDSRRRRDDRYELPQLMGGGRAHHSPGYPDFSPDRRSTTPVERRNGERSHFDTLKAADYNADYKFVSRSITPDRRRGSRSPSPNKERKSRRNATEKSKNTSSKSRRSKVSCHLKRSCYHKHRPVRTRLAKRPFHKTQYGASCTSCKLRTKPIDLGHRNQSVEVEAKRSKSPNKKKTERTTENAEENSQKKMVDRSQSATPPPPEKTKSKRSNKERSASPSAENKSLKSKSNRSASPEKSLRKSRRDGKNVSETSVGKDVKEKSSRKTKEVRRNETESPERKPSSKTSRIGEASKRTREPSVESSSDHEKNKEEKSGRKRRRTREEKSEDENPDKVKKTSTKSRSDKDKTEKSKKKTKSGAKESSSQISKKKKRSKKESQEESQDSEVERKDKKKEKSRKRDEKEAKAADRNGKKKERSKDKKHSSTKRSSKQSRSSTPETDHTDSDSVDGGHSSQLGKSTVTKLGSPPCAEAVAKPSKMKEVKKCTVESTESIAEDGKSPASEFKLIDGENDLAKDVAATKIVNNPVDITITPATQSKALDDGESDGREVVRSIISCETQRENLELTKEVDSQTKAEQTPTEEIDSQTKAEQTPTEDIDSQTKSKQTPTEQIDSQTKAEQTPTEEIDSQTKSKQTPTEEIGSQTTSKQTPTEEVDSQTKAEQTPTEEIGSQTITEQTPTVENEFKGKVKPDQAKDNLSEVRIKETQSNDTEAKLEQTQVDESEDKSAPVQTHTKESESSVKVETKANGSESKVETQTKENDSDVKAIEVITLIVNDDEDELIDDIRKEEEAPSEGSEDGEILGSGDEAIVEKAQPPPLSKWERDTEESESDTTVQKKQKAPVKPVVPTVSKSVIDSVENLIRNKAVRPMKADLFHEVAHSRGAKRKVYSGDEVTNGTNVSDSDFDDSKCDLREKLRRLKQRKLSSQESHTKASTKSAHMDAWSQAIAAKRRMTEERRRSPSPEEMREMERNEARKSHRARDVTPPRRSRGNKSSRKRRASKNEDKESPERKKGKSDAPKESLSRMLSDDFEPDYDEMSEKEKSAAAESSDEASTSPERHKSSKSKKQKTKKDKKHKKSSKSKKHKKSSKKHKSDR